MASFYLLVYFPFRCRQFLIDPQMLYADLIHTVFNYFDIGSNNRETFLLQVFDMHYKDYIEFDDGYINQLRKRLPRTSIESLLARIVCRQQLYLLSRQSFFSMDTKATFPYRSNLLSTTIMSSPSPYLIVWLDSHFGIPENFRSMKRYLSMTIELEGLICNLFWDEVDIDYLIQANSIVDLPRYNRLIMFTDVDQCRDYIANQHNTSILLITSNRGGQTILPSIYGKILNIYILRNSWNHWDWGFDYIEGLQMFDDDQCMFTRIVRDLAQDLVDRATQLTPVHAIEYLQWARRLYIQADQGSLFRSSQFTSPKLKYIDCQLGHLETIVRRLEDDCEDEYVQS